MRALIDAIEAGAFGDVTGILHIGIGGSALGPALLVDALGRAGDVRRSRILSNIDGAALEDAVKPLDPARPWWWSPPRPSPRPRRMLNPDAALRMAARGRRRGSRRPGDRAHREPRKGDRVGRRRDPRPAVRRKRRRALFAVVVDRLPAALALGWDAFEACSKARRRWTAISASPSRRANVPLLAAFADRLYVEQLGCQTRGVFAYDERLRLLPSYLQQLEMESNGKSVTPTASRSSIRPRRSPGAGSAPTRSTRCSSCSTRAPCSSRSSSSR